MVINAKTIYVSSKVCAIFISIMNYFYLLTFINTFIFISLPFVSIVFEGVVVMTFLPF